MAPLKSNFYIFDATNEISGFGTAILFPRNVCNVYKWFKFRNLTFYTFDAGLEKDTLFIPNVGVKLTTHLHLEPRSKNVRRYTSTPQYAFTAWYSVKAQGKLELLPLPWTFYKFSEK
jgi:hypothetical protein